MKPMPFPTWWVASHSSRTIQYIVLYAVGKRRANALPSRGSRSNGHVHPPTSLDDASSSGIPLRIRFSRARRWLLMRWKQAFVDVSTLVLCDDSTNDRARHNCVNKRNPTPHCDWLVLTASTPTHTRTPCGSVVSKTRPCLGVVSWCGHRGIRSGVLPHLATVQRPAALR